MGDWDESGPWANVLKGIKSSRRVSVIVIPSELGVFFVGEEIVGKRSRPERPWVYMGDWEGDDVVTIE